MIPKIPDSDTLGVLVHAALTPNPTDYCQALPVGIRERYLYSAAKYGYSGYPPTILIAFGSLTHSQPYSRVKWIQSFETIVDWALLSWLQYRQGLDRDRYLKDFTILLEVGIPYCLSGINVTRCNIIKQSDNIIEDMVFTKRRANMARKGIRGRQDLREFWRLVRDVVETTRR